MSDNQSNNKRIAKNTLFMYFRMLMNMAVGIITSRVTLNVLGVEDYGIYGVVGGVVAMLSFLNSSMIGATQRFLNFELGRGDEGKLNRVFCSAMNLHLLICAFVFLFLETVGLWFLNNKMVIPENRLFAAHIVYQLSILTSLLSISQVPYNSCIVAHERMDVFAYVDIGTNVMKLLIVYLLLIGNFDKLIFYSILVALVSFGAMMFNRIYCLKHFEESSFHLIWDKETIKPMINFSGWDMFANFGGIARIQGVNILINMFFGPAVNAASSIATTVSGMVLSFGNNVVIAAKPQIVKLYAQNEKAAMVNLIRNTASINFFLMAIVTIPCILELHYVLHLWLGIVPDYAVTFCSLTLIFNIYSNLSFVIISGVHATGNMKRAGITIGIIYVMVLPLTYLSFKLGHLHPWLPYAFNIALMIIGVMSNMYALKLYVKEFPFSRFLIEVVLKDSVIIALVALFIYYITVCHFEEGFVRLLATCLVSILTMGGIGFYLILPVTARRSIVNKFFKKNN